MKQRYKRSTSKSEQNRIYSVAVVATMSAGKSTLLNAMIGQRLLPARNEACTATVCRVEDIDSYVAFQGRVKVNGNWNAWQTPIGYAEVQTWNDSRVDEIELRGNLPWIDNTSDDYRVVLIDTPGPNNSTNLDHARITENILNSCDFAALIFVINAETPGTADEWSFLNKINEAIEMKRGRVQIIFALNKIDKVDPEKNETIVGILRNRLKQISSIGFLKPIMVPVFGDLAIRIREMMSHKKPYKPGKNGIRPRNHKYRHLYEAIGTRRFLMALKTDIENVLNAKSFYRDAMKLTTEVGHALMKYDHRRLSKEEKFDMLLVADKFFRLSEIKKAEKLSGVPILELLLEQRLNEITKTKGQTI